MNRTDTVLAISSWWAENDGDPMMSSFSDHVRRIRSHKRDLRSFRLWFLAALALAVLAFGRRAPAEDVTVRGENGEPWTISINPKPTARSVRSSGPSLVPPAPTTEVALAQVELAQAERPALPPDDTGIEIIPARTRDVSVGGRSYRDIYRSVPYSYTEYLANPGYRHDAAMEILFGQMRPTTIHRHTNPQRVRNVEYTPYRPYLFAQYDYYSTAPLLRPRIYRPIYFGY